MPVHLTSGRKQWDNLLKKCCRLSLFCCPVESCMFCYIMNSSLHVCVAECDLDMAFGFCIYLQDALHSSSTKDTFSVFGCTFAYLFLGGSKFIHFSGSVFIISVKL